MAIVRRPFLAALLLLGFWGLLVASQWNKSLAYDEITHSTAGYTYWMRGDFRIDQTNGNLPKLVAALPLVLGDFRFPPSDAESWRTANEWKLGDEWYHEIGNDVPAMLRRGRAVVAVFAVALGALVWWWARALFGAMGGLLALGLYVLNPTVLAHGALMTSDMATAFFFAAATLGVWRVLHRVTVPRVLASALAVGGLFVCKMSAILLVPIAGVLVVARLGRGGSLPVVIGGRHEIVSRVRQAGVIAAVAVLHVFVAWVVVWGCYGFRYAMFAHFDPTRERAPFTWEHLLGKPSPAATLARLGLTPEQTRRIEAIAQPLLGRRWTQSAREAVPVVEREVLSATQAAGLDELLTAPPPSLPGRVLDFARRHRLLPEAFIATTANGWLLSRSRMAFLNGEVSPFGWWWFFPYTFLVKTPLALFGLCVPAVAGWWRSAERRGLAYATLPLWTLLGVYWAASLTSHLNIGHRHILPVYAPLLVLCGAAGLGPVQRRVWRTALLVLCALLVAETAWRFPNYLAYFNGIVAPDHAHRHLVDSSLDWGQELPAVRGYLEARRPAGRVYFSYFGTGDPAGHGIAATPLFPQPNYVLRSPAVRIEAEAGGTAAAQRQWSDLEPVGVLREGDRRRIVWVKQPAALWLESGTYLISATMLQPLHGETWGPWCQRLEDEYQRLREFAAPWLSDDPQVRDGALRQVEPAALWSGLRRFEEFRFARLTAFLRQRLPDDVINHAVLVYELTGVDLARALDGPPAELGEDASTRFEPPP